MSTSSQHRLSKIRKPRVHITYDLETGGSTEKRELPFVVGIFSDLFGHSKNLPPLKERKLAKIDRANFEGFMAEIAPTLSFAVEDKASSEENTKIKVELTLKSIHDFSPDQFIKQSETMGNLLKKRKSLTDLMAKMDGNDKFIAILGEALKDPSKEKDALDFIKNTGKDESEISNLQELVKSSFEDSHNKSFGDLSEANNLLGAFFLRIANIDKVLSLYANEVLHHPEFQKVEAAWRGLHHFVKESESSERLQIFVLPAKKEELLGDVENALDFDQSILFKKIYEEEYGTFGGTPFSLLVGDYYFGKSPKDISLLKGLSQVAAAAHTPFIGGVCPSLFGMESFLELPNPLDLKSLFASSEFARWNGFRSMDDAKYISLTMPRVMQRETYGKGFLETKDFSFEEQLSQDQHNSYLWGNAAYAMALRITHAFNTYSWCAAIRGVEGGGLVEDLPLHVYTSASGEKITKCPTEVLITDRREKELSELGFLALCYKKHSNHSVFFDCPTVAKTKEYEEAIANANSAIAVQLNYLLAASRFAHYFKVMMRDKIGSFATLGEVSGYLNNWLSKYILLQDNAQPSAKASYPLREGRVDVFEIPGKPGCYSAVCFLKPHFQLNELSISIRMVAELPAPVSGV